MLTIIVKLFNLVTTQFYLGINNATLPSVVEKLVYNRNSQVIFWAIDNSILDLQNLELFIKLTR